MGVFRCCSGIPHIAPPHRTSQSFQDHSGTGRGYWACEGALGQEVGRKACGVGGGSSLWLRPLHSPSLPLAGPSPWAWASLGFLYWEAKDLGVRPGQEKGQPWPLLSEDIQNSSVLRGIANKGVHSSGLPSPNPGIPQEVAIDQDSLLEEAAIAPREKGPGLHLIRVWVSTGLGFWCWTWVGG